VFEKKSKKTPQTERRQKKFRKSRRVFHFSTKMSSTQKEKKKEKKTALKTLRSGGIRKHKKSSGGEASTKPNGEKGRSSKGTPKKGRKIREILHRFLVCSRR